MTGSVEGGGDRQGWYYSERSRALMSEIVGS